MKTGLARVPLVLCLLVTCGASPDATTRQVASERTEQAALKAANRVADAIEATNKVTSDAAKRNTESRPCAPGKEDRSSDMCAQWKAADAAKQAADAADEATGIAWAGLILAVMTTAAAVAAAWYAKSAVTHAQRSADEAAAATAIAKTALGEERQARSQEFRPWITIDAKITHGASWGHPQKTFGPDEVRDDRNQMFFGIMTHFKNIGNQLARDLWFDFECTPYNQDTYYHDIIDAKSKLRAADLEEGHPGYFVMPDQTFHTNGDRTIFVKQKQLEGLPDPWSSKKFALLVIIRATYRSMHSADLLETIKVFWVRSSLNDFGAERPVPLAHMQVSEYQSYTEMS